MCFQQLFVSDNENSILKSAVEEATNLASDGHYSWFSFFNQLCRKGGFDPQINSVKEIKQLLKQKYVKYWKQNFIAKYKDNESGKFETYVTFKQTFKYEPYLNQIKNFKERQALTKFRISNHNLQIETGRYKKPKIPRNERFCDICLTDQIQNIGNEIHFLLKCPNLSKERAEMMNEITLTCPNMTQLEEKNKLIFLMSAENDIIRKIAKFCKNYLPRKNN